MSAVPRGARPNASIAAADLPPSSGVTEALAALRFKAGEGVGGPVLQRRDVPVALEVQLAPGAEQAKAERDLGLPGIRA